MEENCVGVLALPPPPLGSRRGEGISARSPAGRGAGENPPTCTAQTHAACSCGLSLHPEEAERQKAPLSRPRAGSEGDGRGEGRGGRPVETIQTEPSQGDIHPRRRQGFLHTLEGRSGRSGGAGAESLAVVRRLLPVQMGQGSGEGRSERTGRPARSGAGRTRHPRHGYRDARRGSRYAGCPPTCRLDPPRARAGGAFFLLSAPPPVRPHHPALDETMEGRRTRYSGHTYAIRTLREVVMPPP